MCFGIFKKKPATPPLSDATMTKAQVLKKLEEDILIHEYWACKVTEEPGWGDTMGDYDWHLMWIEVYQNCIYYLQGGK